MTPSAYSLYIRKNGKIYEYIISTDTSYHNNTLIASDFINKSEWFECDVKEFDKIKKRMTMLLNSINALLQ